MTGNDHIQLETFWPYRVTVLAHQISRYTQNLVRAQANLNQSQWRVLAAIAEHPGLNAAEVTAITPMDKTIVSRAVASLLQDGLIEKQASAADRRRHALRTTQKGLSIYKKIASHLNATLQTLPKTNLQDQDLIDTLNTYSAWVESLSTQQG